MWHFVLVDQVFSMLLVLTKAFWTHTGFGGFLWRGIAVPSSIKEIQYNKFATSVFLVFSSDRVISRGGYLSLWLTGWVFVSINSSIGTLE